MKYVLVIDGSYGEGGGQIVRTAVALSVLTKQPIEISHIRAGRPIPGLRPQHYTALSCIQQICNAEVEGLSVHSTNLKFTPHDIRPGTYTFDVGTAGSMTLVFQACLLSAFHTSDPLTIKLRGGTDVRWAPSWDYFAHVFLPLISKIGIKTDIQLLKRGYYPTGGGEAMLTIHPIEQLLMFSADEPQNFTDVHGIIHRANLPDHISARMKHAAMKTAMKQNLRSTIQIRDLLARTRHAGSIQNAPPERPPSAPTGGCRGRPGRPGVAPHPSPPLDAPAYRGPLGPSGTTPHRGPAITRRRSAGAPGSRSPSACSGR